MRIHIFPFTLPDVKSKELLRIILFFIHSAITQSKDFPLRSLTEGKKTIYHRNRRRIEDALFDVKSKELLRIIFSMYAFFTFTQSKDFPLKSKERKRSIIETKEEWKTLFTLPNVKSKELLRIIFSFTQSKDFPLRSLTERKKTIYHRNGRREKWKMFFTLPDVKSKELLRIIFFFSYIPQSRNRKIFLWDL